MKTNRTEFKNARKQAVDILRKVDCDDVIRSVLFVLGDYIVSKGKEDAQKRAKYIAEILYYVSKSYDTEVLEYTYASARGIVKALEAKAEREKGGAVC